MQTKTSDSQARNWPLLRDHQRRAAGSGRSARAVFSLFIRVLGLMEESEAKKPKKSVLKVLLTGFGKFHGIENNPTVELVKG